MVTRRNFLRVVGTSAVILAAGGVGLTQCDPMPEAAVGAWKGPAPDLRDPRVRALSFALLAPNPHNMQPWIVDLRVANEVTFICDRTRLLPETDPYARQITIGCGAFLELLRMAAAEQGFRAEITAFPQGDWPANEVGDQPVCRVVFAADAGVGRDGLFAHVLKRRTNRNSYDSKAVTGEEVAAIQASMAQLPVKFGWTNEAGQMARLRGISKRAWDIEISTDATYYESVKVYRLTGDEILRHRDGLSFHGPMFWWLKTLGLFSREKGLQGDSFMRDQAYPIIDGQISNTAAFGWIVTSSNDRRAQLASGAAYVRANLCAAGMGLAMQPLSQALQEYKQMMALLVEHKRVLGLPDSDTAQMFFRIGHAAQSEPSPRRPLDAIIRT